MTMEINGQWRDAWRAGGDQVLIACAGGDEYRLCKAFDNGAYKVYVARVEPASGKEVAVSPGITEYASAEGAGEAILRWGEKLASDWIAGHSAC